LADRPTDPYVLEFLGLPEDPTTSETEVESAIISQLQSFLLEMGHGFSFVARQMRVSTETSHFYLDLVFYHYVLKCFVIIDLKTTKLTHQDIGQIDMYVLSCRSGLLPTMAETPQADTGDWELVTWLVVMNAKQEST
jgi:hypothetical protein